MELVKKNIRMNRWKNHAATQLTLDDDFIVPDTMDDMEQVVLDTGSIQIEASRVQGEKVIIKGKLDFKVLYRKEGGGLQALGGSIPFEETVNVPGLTEHDYVNVTWELDDLNAGMINSRKMNVKALVTLNVQVESIFDAVAAVDVALSGNGEDTEALREELDVAGIAVRKKDTYRVKESISLSGNKPNLEKILWSEVRLAGTSSRPGDGTIHIDGELAVFVIYASEGEGTPVQWLEESIPFSGELEVTGCREDMIPVVSMRLVHREVEAKPDYDGEMRELELDAVVELDMKLYEEERIQLLSDLYSTNRELLPETGEVCFDQILTKNLCKCKISEKMEISRHDRILQICHSEGAVKIDEVEVKDDTLHIDGVLEVQLLYLTDDDSQPIQSVTEVAPFHQAVEAKGIDENSIYQLNASLDNMSAVMLGGSMVELRAVVNLDLLVLQPVCRQVITGVDVQPLDVEKLQRLPGIVGYIVQPGDSLWKIAKKFHTTVDNVMETNGLTSDLIMPGEKLILVKEIAQG